MKEVESVVGLKKRREPRKVRGKYMESTWKVCGMEKEREQLEKGMSGLDRMSG